jgi:hypothetical protein
MPKYNVDKEIWIAGIKKPVGSQVDMTEAQAKYLKHALSKVGDEAPAAAPAVEAAAAPEATVAGVSVTEKPAKAKRKADADGAAD